MPRLLVNVTIIGWALLLMMPLVAQENPQTKTTHNYILVFDMIDYSPKVESAINMFFNKVFQDGDQLIVVTPAKSIGYSPQKLTLPKDKLCAELLNTLKMDILSGASRYRDTLSSMRGIVAQLLNSGNADLSGYIQGRRNLVTWRGSVANNLEKYAKIFNAIKGENHLIMFMQEELRPVPNDAALNRVLENSRETLFTALEAFNNEIDRTPFDYQRVLTAFRYVKLRFHFFYFNLPTARAGAQISYVDNLADLQADLKKLAQDTNGVVMNSSKPEDFLSQVRTLIYEGKVETEVISESMEKK